MWGELAFLSSCLIYFDAGPGRPHYLLRVFVVAHARKGGMAQMVCCRSFAKLEGCDSFGTKPYAFLHLCGREPLSPAPSLFLWKIYEGTPLRLQVFDLFEYLPPDRWHEAGTYCDKHLRHSCIGDYATYMSAFEQVAEDVIDPVELLSF